MNATLLVIFCQTTCVLSIGLVAIRILRNRYVELAASIGNLTSISAAVLVVVCCLGLPRPLSIKFDSQGDATDHPISANQDTFAKFASGSSPIANSDSVNVTFITFGLGSDYRAQVESSSWVNNSIFESSRWAVFVAAFGAILFVVFILRLLLGIQLAFRLTTQGVCLPATQWPLTVRNFYLAHSDKVQNVTIKVHEAIGSPCVHAFSRNTIFVPPGFLKWSEEEAVSAFAHEFAHLRRRDSLWRFLGEICLSLVALHPLSHLMRRNAVLAQELATDLLAAELLGSPRRYQLGLSRLLLRFDRQLNGFDRRVGYGVGVSVFSSSLIRRIEMLGQGQKIKAGARKKLTCALFVSACVGVVLCGSWGVVADEPPRVAALPKSSDKKVEPKLFARSKQWIPANMNARSGYLRLDVTALQETSSGKMAMQLLELTSKAAQAELFGSGDTKFSDFGFKLNEIEQIEASIQGSLQVNRQEESTEPDSKPHKFNLSFGGNGLRMKTRNSVDWPSLVRSLNTSLFGPDPNVIAKLAESLEASETLTIVPKESESDSVSNITVSLQSIWDLCDGGIGAAVVQVPDADKVLQELANQTSQDELEPAQQRALQIFKSTSAVGLGIDAVEDRAGFAFRIVFLAKAGTDAEQLLVAIEAQRTNDIKGSETAGALQGLLDAYLKADARIERDPAGNGFVVLEFSYDPVMAAMLNM